MFDFLHDWFGVRWYIRVRGVTVLVYATSEKAALRLAEAKYNAARAEAF